LETLNGCIDSILEQTETAKENKLDSIWAGQHFAIGPFKMFQPVPILSRVSALSGHMQVGTAISLLSMQNPIRVAEEMATLDWITEGRLVFGAGIGYRDEEFEVMGKRKSNRAKRFVECIELMKKWWTENTVTYHGEHFSISEKKPSLHPFQPGGPKIWIAGEVEASIRRAALIGDCWIPLPIPNNTELSDKLKFYREQVTSAGLAQSTEQPLMREVYISDNDEKAYELAAPYLMNKYKAYASWGQEESAGSVDSIEEDFRSFCNNRFLIGSPETIQKSIINYRDNYGISHLICRIQWPGMKQKEVLETIRALGVCKSKLDN